jgi:hypothetical protein
MNPHYYLMKNKKILRLEGDETFESLPAEVKALVFDEVDMQVMDQDQANWRVVIFRDEIMELPEFQEWMTSYSFSHEQEDMDLIAN